jgi:predicted DNA-binding transcriptional regulator AlpA
MATDCTAPTEPATLDTIASLLRELLAATKTPSPMIDRTELADLLRIGETKLDTLRSSGKIGPAEVKLGRSVLWNREEVLAWLASPSPRGELWDSAGWAMRWRDSRRKSK